MLPWKYTAAFDFLTHVVDGDSAVLVLVVERCVEVEVECGFGFPVALGVAESPVPVLTRDRNSYTGTFTVIVFSRNLQVSVTLKGKLGLNGDDHPGARADRRDRRAEGASCVIIIFLAHSGLEQFNVVICCWMIVCVWVCLPVFLRWRLI
jgi:hypothetical protein